MDSTNILLAGLPAAGKSTYITALWAVEKDGKSGHLLTCDGIPSESSYVDGMRDNWMVLKEVRRTTFAEPQEIVLPMKRKKDGTKVCISLPDFKGEIFKGLLENNISKDIEEWCNKSNGILFMLNLGNSSPESLQEQVGDNPRPIAEVEKVVMTSDDIDLAIQNVLLLKFLYNKMGDCPISVCFSGWDKSDNPQNLPVEEWVKINHPCIYNFISAHFEDYRFFGISAQGADYSELNEENEDEMAEKTTLKERAYIYSKRISYDITEPIDFLIRD